MNKGGGFRRNYPKQLIPGLLPIEVLQTDLTSMSKDYTKKEIVDAD